MSIDYSPIEGGGLQRTDMHCHACNKNFIAELDFDIEGNHTICCPHCNHEHCRKIENGKILSTRWDSRPSEPGERATTWRSSVIKAQTSTVGQFLRDMWLNRDDVQRK